ncbi:MULTISPECIES: YaeQ family protein [unclassified Oceanobacter]|jgi:uncharacterized protein YaeQ|uniref:YaeQ family protein n=1 Tax=unclassified Oceanobacter TaxID=2620260 RepID=UPI00273756DC|nr:MULTISPECIES: YaeQ family protein [unclassified Oceanobacter]MDP2504766.1 YaeQ family protein [Oceanobacter sp. 3_MG-2023]MDP2546208.1 YaeQ family protein [Oceanobacter sp. 4_MG-2023]MDP2607511.1 YaeQ family protein [Oceanobacter sp. 1_MG-2023]MDP2610779.1 YaeQ family protein [Oceanobacter sp. 2_MG-2023]
MAIKATICKIELAVSDMDRHHYQTYNLTVAQHPSETLTRLMTRIAVFALNASDTLEFTRGLSTDDEPELWEKDYSDQTLLWIELGQPDEKRIRKACQKAQQVRIYEYHGRTALPWWDSLKNSCARFDNLSVYNLDADAIAQLTSLYDRTMRLQASIQDATLWLGNDQGSIEIQPQRLHPHDS